MATPSYTVLMIEDQESSTAPVGKCLRRAGYKVLYAFNGRQAFQMLEDNTTEVVLLDLALPDMIGIDLLQELRRSEDWKKLPAVVFSGSGDVANVVAGLGVTACLIKSQSGPTEIREAIKKALGQ